MKKKKRKTQKKKKILAVSFYSQVVFYFNKDVWT